MSFVHEYASKEDIEKYRLKELRKEHGYNVYKDVLWTRDRERKSFLMRLRGLTRDDDDQVFLMRWKGQNTVVRVYGTAEGNFSQRPYRMFWHFLGFERPCCKSDYIPPEEQFPEFFALLKEALTAYELGETSEWVPPSEVVVGFVDFPDE